MSHADAAEILTQEPDCAIQQFGSGLLLMIVSFRHKGLKQFFETGSKRGIPDDLAARLGRRLDVLEAAQELSDIDAHGFHLHPLKGNREGQWAIWVNRNWRITFRFVNGEALGLDLEDYH